jgi:hypothetical protein
MKGCIQLSDLHRLAKPDLLLGLPTPQNGPIGQGLVVAAFQGWDQGPGL